MLTSAELRELKRCFELRKRGIITDDEVVARLARICRRGKLDAVLANIPAAMAVPLKEFIKTGPEPQAYSPASLPAVDEVHVVVIDSAVEVTRVGDRIHAAGLRSVELAGEDAEFIARLWRQLPPDEQARCHIPTYGLRFYAGSALLCEASICWRCNNIFGQANGASLVYKFDGESSVAVDLFRAIQRTVGDTPTSPSVVDG